VETPGSAYIHILSACPTGWRCPTDDAIKVGRLAVRTGIFPLYEVEKGQYKLNLSLSKLEPVETYLKTQGRFRHLTEGTIKEIQKRVTQEYNKLVELAGKSGEKAASE